ncbi:PTS sugar transporter subunit IIA [Candidatus Persebacteraceae bacterium Df01]|jgi:PTS system nitrogen regulatory IIA component|uniref:PTS sugar transporter subunit IIA n=1 Tax=Candidatus Doriopsillibacter californiensis TaxID=2970740 RepID=A0ABT7QL63_9GAMM|nr:PTS sugar transporter subunit IIA [Candidatus Persebacteraceae bacterium Df01]
MTEITEIGIARRLPPAHILLGIDWQSKKRVFEQISIVFENTSGIAREQFFSVLFERERLGSTFIGEGGAIPHGRLGNLKEPLCALVMLKHPIQYGVSDDGGGAVQVLFFLIAPQEANDIHLCILGVFAEMLSDQQLINNLWQCAEPEKVQKIIANWEKEKGLSDGDKE